MSQRKKDMGREGGREGGTGTGKGRGKKGREGEKVCEKEEVGNEGMEGRKDGWTKERMDRGKGPGGEERRDWVAVVGRGRGRGRGRDRGAEGVRGREVGGGWRERGGREMAGKGTGACAMAALKPVRPQKQKPARDEMLKLLPHIRSSFSVNGRQISSRQVETRLMLVFGLKPCNASIRVECSIRILSGTARGKHSSSKAEYLRT